MRKLVFYIFIIFAFASCSFKTAPNDWQYKSANYFSLYTNNFLKDNDILAKNDMRRAVDNAKKSADFTILARIYLGECALNISTGLQDKCEKYQMISDLLEDETLSSYYGLVTKTIKSQQIKSLPREYREYSTYLEKSEFEEAGKYVFKTDKVTASLLMASLMRENLTDAQRDKLVKLASFHGYKKAVIFWLHESGKYAKDTQIAQSIDKKINVLNAKSER